MPAAGNAQVTQAWLRSTWHIQVPRPWLDACVEWVLEEAGGVAVSQPQLNQQVLDQWLLTDLRDLVHPVLPAGVAEVEKTELNGCYCLQMDSLLDVSQPAYSQLQKVRGADCTNEQVTAVTQATQKPWEAKPTRMLMLQLTDGVQSLEGMEYRPIPALNANLPPGTKLQLMGTVVVRLGVLLLKPENVRILGGEVEQLVERHSQTMVLCRTLGLPEENHPQAAEPDDQELLAGVDVVESQLGGNSLDSGYDTVTTQASVRAERSHNHQVEPSLQVTPASNSWNGADPPDEDFDDIPDNFDYLPEDFDDIPMDELDVIMTPTEAESLPRNEVMEYGRTDQQVALSSDSVRANTVGGTLVSEHNSHHRGSSAQMVDAGASDDSFTSPEPKMARYEPVSTSIQTIAQASAHEPSNKAKPDLSILNYLCILQAGVWPPSTVEVVRLQAFIVTLLGNLRCSGGEWKLGATISDGTGYLDVDLCDTLLSGLIGFSATESRTLRKDPAMRGVVDAGIQNCQRELVDMCCVMSVRVEPSGKSVLLKTDPPTHTECCELQKRVTERRS